MLKHLYAKTSESVVKFSEYLRESNNKINKTEDTIVQQLLQRNTSKTIAKLLNNSPATIIGYAVNITTEDLQDNIKGTSDAVIQYKILK